jgi:hypothetical protein
MSEVHPTYVRSALRGWDAALKEGKAIPWEPIVDLLGFVSQQPDEGDEPVNFQEDPGWRWSHQEAARLLRTGLLRNEELRPPARLRTEIWAILERLAESPHPSPAHEAQYGGDNMDALSLSLNVARAQAIAAVIAYLSWLIATEQIAAEGTRETTAPEVWQLLSSHLDPSHDPSAAVRVPYGQDFPFLAHVSPDWAAENVDALFGLHEDDPEGQARRDAAWDAYVTTHNPNVRMLELLAAIYVDRITRETDATSASEPQRHSRLSSASRTALHILVLYAVGAIGIDTEDGLLQGYFTSGDPENRGEALGDLGWTLFNDKADTAVEIIDRLQTLWDWRQSVAAESGLNDELSGFGWWFRSKKFPREWSIRHLVQVAQAGEILKMAGLIAEELTDFVQEFPGECLDVIEGLMTTRETWEIYTIAEHAPAVLAAALDSDMPELIAKAEGILEQLGRAGYLETRDRVDGLRGTSERGLEGHR